MMTEKILIDFPRRRVHYGRDIYTYIANTKGESYEFKNGDIYDFGVFLNNIMA